MRHLLAAWVDGLQLLNDTGSSPTDLVTSDPQVTGTVQGDFTDGYVEVEFDHFANGYVDGYVYAFGPGEQFTYDPRWYDYSLEDYAGSFTLNYRTVEYDSSYNAVTGAWQSFTYTLEVPVAPEISVVQQLDGYTYVLDSGWGWISFGSTTVGTPVDRVLTIANRGQATLLIDVESLALPAGFSAPGLFASSVAPGDSTTLVVRLDASAAGHFSGTASFSSNDSYANPFTFYVDGSVEPPAPEMVVTVDSSGYPYQLYNGWEWIYFDSVPAGSTASKTFTIHNTGSADLLLDSNSLSVPPGFSVTSWFASIVSPGAWTDMTNPNAIGCRPCSWTRRSTGN